MEKLLDAPLEAHRLSYGGADVRCSVQNNVLSVFLLGPVTPAVSHKLAVDMHLRYPVTMARASVVFLGRCVLMTPPAVMAEAMLIQGVWGRQIRPCALVGNDTQLPGLHEYADLLGQHGFIREVFSTARSFEALAWAQARAETRRRQAIYLSRTSGG
jgi:hypothetical protein